MSTLIDFFHRYGLIAMFICILLEYGCFPVSSEIVLPLSGAIASFEEIPTYVIIPLSILAGLIGTSGCFFVGRFGGKKILTKLSLRFPKTKKPLEASFQKFDENGVLAVCIGRVIPICRTYIAFVAGASKLSYPRFLLASLIGISVWNTLLISLGYLLRDNWNIIFSYYHQYKQFALLILIFILSFVLLKALLTKK